MKSSNAYRFSLSWGLETEEQVLVGELLERLGNKKSKFIIQLVSEYIQNHPEIMDKEGTIKFVIESSSTCRRLEDAIREIIQAEIAGRNLTQPGIEKNDVPQVIVESKGVAAMFDNLKVWET